MNQENSNSDKITIKVRHSDEDYHDITIDWSNENFDFRKQLFHQLSAYTGIPIKQQKYYSVLNVRPRRGGGLLNAEYEIGSLHAFWNSIARSSNTKERAMEILHDGDCFLIETMMHVDADVPGMSCSYQLVHRDVANESGCNLQYCHYLGGRSFTRKISEFIEAYQSQLNLDPMFYGQTKKERLISKLSVYNDHNREIMSIVDAHPAPKDCRIRHLALRISNESFEEQIQTYIAPPRVVSNIFFRSEVNQENRNSDKITIKVRHSDEDYHEITIDWSNESFDYRKQLFHQLSAYTGGLYEQQECVKVHNVNGNGYLLNHEFRNGLLVGVGWGCPLDNKESAMKAFHDGDCFLIETIMKVNLFGYGISCAYRLVHRDLANESGCNPEYCQYLGRRSFTRKISEIIKAEYSQPILDPMDRQAKRERNTFRENLHFDHYKEMKSMADAHSVPDCKLKLFVKTEEDRKKAREMAGSEFDQ